MIYSSDGLLSVQGVYTRHNRTTFSHPYSSLELLDLSSVMSRLSLDKDKKWVHRESSILAVILAVILAYSLMRLHESPWLSSPLTSDSISFLDDWQSEAHDTERVKLRRPFTHSQVSASAGAPEINCCRQFKTILPHRNANLHALGVILLELHLNRSLDPDVQRRIDEGGSADYRSVAIAVLEDYSTDMNMTPFYNRAICFCVAPRPSPENRTFNFEDQGFREIFYNEVITNLEENLRARFEVEKDFFD